MNLNKAIPLSIMLLFYLVAQIFLWQQHSFPLIRLETDGIEYMTFATGKIFHLSPYHGPGYPLFIRLIHLILNVDLFSAAKLVSIIAGGLFIVVSWYLFYNLSNSKFVTVAALVFFTVNSVFLISCNAILSDALAVALLYTSFALLLKNTYYSKGLFFLAGIIGGLAYLTRYIYGLILIVPFLMVFSNRSEGTLTLRFFKAVEFVGGFFLVVSPWMVYLYIEKGNPFWNHNYLNIAFRMYHFGYGWNQFPDVGMYQSLFSVILRDPQVFFQTWISSIFDFPGELMKLYPMTGWVSIPGLIYFVMKPNAKKSIYIFIMLGFALVTSLFWYEKRFLLVFLPLVALLIAFGLSIIPDIVRHNRIVVKPPQIHLRWLALFTLFGISLYQTLPVVEYYREQATEYQDAATWLHAHAENGAVILAAKPHIPFFGQGIWADFRNFDLQHKQLKDLPCLLYLANPDYVVFDERYASVEFPQFNVLLDPSQNQFSDFLVTMVVFDQPQKLVLYRYNHNENVNQCP